MDKDEAFRKRQALGEEQSGKGYVRSKLGPEVQDRLEAAILRVVQGLQYGPGDSARATARADAWARRGPGIGRDEHV
jgi:hypothetical protein